MFNFFRNFFAIDTADSTSSADKWMGVHTIMHNGWPYMTRYWIGRLRLHIFHQGDSQDDPHDHPWAFYTFPLTSYVEEVTEITDNWVFMTKVGLERPQYTAKVYDKIVKRFRLHYRPPTHTHRVLGAWDGKMITRFNFDTGEAIEEIEVPHIMHNKKIVTIVWQCGAKRDWGFWKLRDGQWCWQYWKDYVLRDGKGQPCQ